MISFTSFFSNNLHLCIDAGMIFYKNYRLLCDLEKIITYDFILDGSLIIFNVTETDIGMYECIADNGRDRQSAEAKFTVRELPTPSSTEASTNHPPAVPYNIGEPTPGQLSLLKMIFLITILHYFSFRRWLCFSLFGRGIKFN